MIHFPAHLSAQLPAPSDWVVRWTGLIPATATALDVACGQGRHMKWLSDHGIQVTGVDRDTQALRSASAWGTVCEADIESAPWPLTDGAGSSLQFDAVIVTNYLWRPLLPTLLSSVSDGGVFIYETFSQGNQLFGKPSRPDFLLQPGELLSACLATPDFTIVAYENGVLNHPDRCVQRIVAVKSPPTNPPHRLRPIHGSV